MCYDTLYKGEYIMALRKIRLDEDPILRKLARPITEITPKIEALAEDMIETMNDANGVGLAAPQVGILKRIVVVDVGEGPVVFINPEIMEQDGEQVGPEGCLSLPGKTGIVSRPNHVIVKAMNLDGEAITVEAEGFYARAICHEIDHLNGQLYIDIAERMLTEEEMSLAEAEME